MKIAIDCRFLGKSGIGTFVENVTNELIKSHLDYEFLLVVGQNAKWEIKECNVKLLKTPIKPFSIKELFFFPVSEINKCDAYFSPYINIPSRISIPIYSTIHDMVFFDVEGLSSPSGKVIRKFFYRRAIRLSEVIFTVSQFSKDRIQFHFHTNKRIEIVYNGVSKVVQNFDTNCLPQKKDYYIFVGNIKCHKGLHTLVEAFVKARKCGLKSKLVIVGSADNFRTTDSQLVKQIEEIHEIEFTGWVTNQRLLKLISEAKALVQPSLYEGFGLPPLEAICLGTDIIISDIPVFKELYSDIPNCFFKAGDSDELAGKLLEFEPCLQLNDYKKALMKKYNYYGSAERIIKTIVDRKY